MALTSSGTISMSDIRTELGDSGAISLKEASDGTIATINTANDADDRPNGSAPHAMSEFYSYDHSASSPSTAFNAPSNFSMPSGRASQVLYSGVKTIAVTTGPFSGNTTVSCAGGTFGTLKVALAASSGGPFNSYDTSKSIAQSGTTSVFAKFQITITNPGAAAGGSSARTITLTNGSGASTTFTVTVQADDESGP
jgi:hypothetical protein